MARDSGADGSWLRTPLMAACANGHAVVLEVLLDDDYDADPTVQDHQGR